MEGIKEIIGKIASQTYTYDGIFRIRAEGLEPPHLAAPDPKSGVSTNSTTLACFLKSEKYFALSFVQKTEGRT